MDKTRIKEINSSIKNISGWFYPEAALLIGMLNNFHEKLNIKGDIFEIGVHHGKSAIFFSHLLKDDEQLSICDIFDNQIGNISISGQGNQTIFSNNYDKFSKKKLKQVFTCLSSDLKPLEIGNSFRIFHIDGGHNCNEALSDLILGSQVITEDGLIVLDDPFRPEWPGVTEALIEFLKTYPDFAPLVVGFNKLIIVRKEKLNQYKSFIDDLNNRIEYELTYPFSYKKLPFMDEELRIFFTPSGINVNSLKVKIQRVINKSDLLKYLESIMGKILYKLRHSILN
jgi:hypothetical protein